MDILRKLIIERTEHDAGGPWALDIYYHLIGHGVDPAVAINAMTSFVDEVIEMKAHQASHE